MISGQSKKFKQTLSSFKYLRNEKNLPSCSQTIDLWSIGNGKIPNKKVKVSGWNINGLRALLRKNALTPFLQAVKPDFLCLNETKVDYKAYQNEFQKNEDMPKGYYQYWNFCKISSGYSGIMILTPHKPLRIIEDIPDEKVFSLQGRVLTLEYQSFFVVSVYKPNPGKKLDRMDYVIRYETAFNKFMFQLLKQKDVIMFGDFQMAHTDLDLHNPEANVGKPGCLDWQRQPLTDLLEGGFFDTYRYMHPKEKKYTYWARFYNSRARGLGWRMDYTLSSACKLKILSSQIHDEVEGSDHCPVSTVMQILE